MNKLKYLIIKYWYKLLTFIGLHKPISANKMKDLFLENYNHRSKGFTDSYSHRMLDKAQESFIKERYNKLIEGKDEK